MIVDLFSLSARTCLITGASRGLGRTMVEAFLEAGAARVYITARKAAEVEATASELTKAFEGECIPLAGDLSRVEDVHKLATEIAERDSHLDVLVNNAGRGWLAPLGQFPEQGWDKVMDLNVKSPFFLTQALVPLLTKRATQQNTSSVINIGSIAGINAPPAETYSYNVSKAAMHQTTRNLAVALAEQHVRVNAIAPGRFLSACVAALRQPCRLPAAGRRRRIAVRGLADLERRSGFHSSTRRSPIRPGDLDHRQQQ